MSIRKTGFRCLALIFLLVMELLPVKPVHAAITTVYVTPGSSDEGFYANEYVCTLREAIRAVNNHKPFDGCAVDSSTNEIVVPAGNFVLTRYGLGEEYAWYGDLDIRTSVTIRGQGASRTTIYQDTITYPTDKQDRIFDIMDPAYISGTPSMTVTIENLTIQGGFAQEGTEGGAGILNNNAKLILNGVILRENEAAIGLNGGGVRNGDNAILEVHDTTFDSNTASIGGGIYNRNQATITHSLFVGNKAITSGGGLDNDPKDRTAGFMHLTNVTVTQNTVSASNSGAGINNSGNLVGAHLTIASNYGIGLFLNGDNTSLYTATLSSSILAYHTQDDPAKSKPDCQMQTSTTRFTSGGYNLVKNNENCSFTDGNDISGQDPLLETTLSTIQNSATRTFKFILTPGTQYSTSPAVDAIPADNALCKGENALDQLYQTRPGEGDGEAGSGCDIGAYELGGAPTRITYNVFLPVLSKIQ